MKTFTIKVEAHCAVNVKNEREPVAFAVTTETGEIIHTTDLGYALQCFLNRIQ
jgi:hypothetical protein